MGRSATAAFSDWVSVVWISSLCRNPERRRSIQPRSGNLRAALDTYSLPVITGFRPPLSCARLRRALSPCNGLRQEPHPSAGERERTNSQPSDGPTGECACGDTLGPMHRSRIVAQAPEPKVLSPHCSPDERCSADKRMTKDSARPSLPWCSSSATRRPHLLAAIRRGSRPTKRPQAV